MAPFVRPKISAADVLVLGAIQILIGIFHVFMWYFLLILYIGQNKGNFGTYEPITYKTGCALWGIAFIISGVVLIRVARHPTQHLIMCALVMNIFSVITTIVAAAFTAIELSTFHSLSYRNYGQAKLGREVSRILLFSYPLELAIALTYSITGYIDLLPVQRCGHVIGFCQSGAPAPDFNLEAIQMITGLILHWLGLIWTYLFATQLVAFGTSYIPVSTVVGYPFWSSVCFIFSGIFTVLLEKRRSKLLVSCTIIMNIISACISVIGLLLLLLEFLIFRLSSAVPIWPHRSGKMLSQYLFLFTFLELFVTCIVIHWTYKAKYRGQ